MVPGRLVPHNGSPIDWSLENSPQPIWSPWTDSPKNVVPMDKWSPTNLAPLDKGSLEYSVCPRGQAVGIPKYGYRICWGPFVQGDRKSGTGMGSWPNALQPSYWNQITYDLIKAFELLCHTQQEKYSVLCWWEKSLGKLFSPKSYQVSYRPSLILQSWV